MPKVGQSGPGCSFCCWTYRTKWLRRTAYSTKGNIKAKLFLIFLGLMMRGGYPSGPDHLVECFRY